MKKAITLVLLGAVMLLSGAPNLMAQDKPSYKPFAFGISAGMVLPGTINLGGIDISTSMSPYFKAHLDAYLVEKLSMGIYASYLTLSMDRVKGSSVSIPDNMNGASGFEIGGTIKPCFKLSDAVTMKPGVEIGYRYINPEMTDVSGSNISGFALNAAFEFKFKAGGISPFIAPGFISQPAGGNDFDDITWAPIFTVAGGLEF
jgi:hypothetical protein